jgi:hypothetical protein
VLPFIVDFPIETILFLGDIEWQTVEIFGTLGPKPRLRLEHLASQLGFEAGAGPEFLSFFE